MLTLETYLTSDIWIASYLRARGARLTGTTRSGSRVIFEFEDRDHCEQLAMEYVNGGAVEVNSLKAAWNDLKTIIFER